MTSKKIKLGMLAILLVFVAALACAADRGGNLTVTGIPAGLNGFYVAFVDDGGLLGMESFNENTFAVTRVRISGGRAILPMWILNQNTGRPERFSGNRRVQEGLLTVGNGRTIFFHEISGAVQMFNDITFTNGNATIYWGLGRRVRFDW